MAIVERAVYATQPTPLRAQITEFLRTADTQPLEGEVMGVIVPDTNLLTGGRIAANIYKILEGKQFDTVILIAPSHSGAFRRMNICNLDVYRTPLGTLAVNDRVRNELCDEDDDIYLSNEGHFHTEGVDVQLPFLQAVLPTFDIVPIVMGDESPEFCRELGHAVGEIMYNRRTLVVASANVIGASEEDLKQFQAYFEALDASRLMTLLNSEKVHMEGKGAVLVVLLAALHRRANQARVLQMQPPQGSTPGFVGGVLWRH